MKVIIALFIYTVMTVNAETEITPEEKAAKIEIVLRQQRELEADSLCKNATEAQKNSDYEDASEQLTKAIKLYEKSSASSQRILTKKQHTLARLALIYKLYGQQVLDQADKEKSTALYDKADKLFLKAKNTLDRARKITK